MDLIRSVLIIILGFSVSLPSNALIYRAVKNGGVKVKQKQYKASNTLYTLKVGEVLPIDEGDRYISGDYIRVKFGGSNQSGWVRTDAGKIDFYDKRYALLIGIDKYRTPDNKLEYAVNDTKNLAEALLKIGYSKENIRILDTPETTTLQSIKKALIKITRDVGENDSILIAFSGHGATEKIGDSEISYIVPSDASLGDEYHNYLPLSDLKERVRKTPADAVFLLLNSCFGGNIFEKFRGAHSLTFKDYGKKRFLVYARDISMKHARQALTAGGAGQTVPDDGPFMNAFILAITTPAADGGDGIVTATEVMQYVKANASGGITPDKGELAGHELGDFVFAKKLPDELQRQNIATSLNDLKQLRDRLHESLRVRDSTIDDTILRDSVLEYLVVERKLAQRLSRKPGIIGMDLSNLELVSADFSGFEIRKTKFQKTVLNGANFEDVNASEVNFHNAMLSDANFKKANLRNVDFTGAVMRRVDLSGAKNLGASVKWKDANIYKARMSDKDREYATYSGAISQGSPPNPPSYIMIH